MKMTLTLMQIEAGKCPCCGGKWENNKCTCCGAFTSVDHDRITLSIPHEGVVVLARKDDDKIG